MTPPRPPERSAPPADPLTLSVPKARRRDHLPLPMRLPRQCFTCGYDLSAAPDLPRCPECGKPAIDARDVLDGHAVALRRRRHAGVVLLALLFVGFVLLTIWLLLP